MCSYYNMTPILGSIVSVIFCSISVLCAIKILVITEKMDKSAMSEVIVTIPNFFIVEYKEDEAKKSKSFQDQSAKLEQL